MGLLVLLIHHSVGIDATAAMCCCCCCCVVLLLPPPPPPLLLLMLMLGASIMDVCLKKVFLLPDFDGIILSEHG
jgi:hypothetical protein